MSALSALAALVPLGQTLFSQVIWHLSRGPTCLGERAEVPATSRQPHLVYWEGGEALPPLLTPISRLSSTRAPLWLACPTTGQSGFQPGSYSKPGPPFLTWGTMVPSSIRTLVPIEEKGAQSLLPAWCPGWLSTPPSGVAGLPAISPTACPWRPPRRAAKGS